MMALSGLLFSRIGLLLVLAFIMTRLRAFRYLLDRNQNIKNVVYSALLFGLFAIIGTEAGLMVRNTTVVPHGFITRLLGNETLIGPSLVATVIAGLFGGPIVGTVSGFIASIFIFYLGGDNLIADVCIHPITGMLSGWTARFFSQERVISSQKALFIGLFAPVLHMALLLIFTTNPQQTILLVDQIGLPLVVTNSVAIAVFTAMIRVVVFEQEQTAAMETQRALKIAEKALPHLRKGWDMHTADKIAELLYFELRIAAVSVTDNRQVLAYIGAGADHHIKGQPLQARLARVALESGQMQVTTNRSEISCNHENCPIHAIIIVPLRQSGEVVGLVNLCFARAQELRPVEINLAIGLGKLISNQLDVVAAEQMKDLTRNVKLRTLQAQIQPHFLFNTLQMITTLIRVDPPLARHVTIALGNFMRMNLRTSDHALIPLRQEIDHLEAYLEIIKVRFSDRIRIISIVPTVLKPALIPPFTLQPLVENSIKHGFDGINAVGEICITITQNDSFVSVEIKDNGCGIPQHIVQQIGRSPVESETGAGIGLFNLNQRLVGLLGNNAALHFQNGADSGCSVSFHIPVAH
jgi:two-component system, LytTR family, sensor histidine kinase LytS